MGAWSGSGNGRPCAAGAGSGAAARRDPGMIGRTGPGVGYSKGPGAIGVIGSRGPAAPLATRSPELSGSFPADLLPREARLPVAVSPCDRPSILVCGHSNERCCTPEPHIRMRVR